MSSPEKDDVDEDRGRKMDPEIKVLSALVRTIDDLEEPARARVVAWLASRYAEQSK